MTADTESITVRPATLSDFDQIWEIFYAVIKSGDTFAWSPSTSKEEARDIWFNKHTRPYVATVGHKIEGAYFVKPNQPGLGSHVANAAYMVNPAARSKGVGAQLGRHSLTEAKSLGYQAMQFNFVISTNERAIALWKRLGFAVIGTIPKAYRHAQLGSVDALIMHRFLDESV